MSDVLVKFHLINQLKLEIFLLKIKFVNYCGRLGGHNGVING